MLIALASCRMHAELLARQHDDGDGLTRDNLLGKSFATREEVLILCGGAVTLKRTRRRRPLARNLQSQKLVYAAATFLRTR